MVYTAYGGLTAMRFGLASVAHYATFTNNATANDILGDSGSNSHKRDDGRSTDDSI